MLFPFIFFKIRLYATNHDFHKFYFMILFLR